MEQLRSISSWSQWLAEPDQWEQLTVLRQRVERGLPCGTDEFVRALELHLGHKLRATARGRPKSTERQQTEKGVRPFKLKHSSYDKEKQNRCERQESQQGDLAG